MIFRKPVGKVRTDIEKCAKELAREIAKSNPNIESVDYRSIHVGLLLAWLDVKEGKFDGLS